MSLQIITSQAIHRKNPLKNLPKPLITPLAVLFCAALNAGIAQAATTKGKNTVEEIPWYQIEVIIYANKTELGLNSEKWPEAIQSKSYPEVMELHYPDEIPAQPALTKSQSATASTLSAAAKTSLPKLDPVTGASIAPAPVAEPVEPVQPYVFLSNEDFNLNSIANDIAKSSRYEMILHIGWRQPTLAPEKANPVYVYEGMTKKLPPVAKGSAFPGTRTMSNDPNASQNLMITEVTPGPNSGLPYVDPKDEMYEGPVYPRLTGTLRLGVSRYLHLQTDLHMRLPFMVQQEVVPTQASEPETSGGFSSFFGVNQQPLAPVMQEHEALTDFSLTESRRLRSSEIHYFDNPMFGVIVQVIPFDPYPKVEAQTTAP